MNTTLDLNRSANYLKIRFGEKIYTVKTNLECPIAKEGRITDAQLETLMYMEAVQVLKKLDGYNEKSKYSVTLFDVKNEVEVQMKDNTAPIGELYVSKKKKAHDNLDCHIPMDFCTQTEDVICKYIIRHERLSLYKH